MTAMISSTVGGSRGLAMAYVAWRPALVKARGASPASGGVQRDPEICSSLAAGSEGKGRGWVSELHRRFATAEKVLELVPAEQRKENRLRPVPRNRLTTSELALLFAYKLTFTELGEKPTSPIRAAEPNRIAERSIQLGSSSKLRGAKPHVFT